jgi:hypothetical protein
VYQRTIKVTVTNGSMPDVLLRLDSELAPAVRAAPGFLGYFAVGTDEGTLFTTRIFQDHASLQAETDGALPITSAIADEFGFADPETIIDAPIGVFRGYGPIEELTP